MNISRAKTTVNTWLLMRRMYLSRDHGGMLGLSMASVMQLAEIKVRMMKSNQPCEVRSANQILREESGGKMYRE